MSIRSHAFGRVTLTGEDAKKFENQVSHGKPKKAAIENVKHGISLSRQFQKQGKVIVTVRSAKGRGGR